MLLYENEKTKFDENGITLENGKNVNILSLINMHLQKTTKIYRTKNCLYCNKLANRFGRHLLSVHKQEDVRTI